MPLEWRQAVSPRQPVNGTGAPVSVELAGVPHTLRRTLTEVKFTRRAASRQGVEPAARRTDDWTIRASTREGPRPSKKPTSILEEAPGAGLRPAPVVRNLPAGWPAVDLAAARRLERLATARTGRGWRALQRLGEAIAHLPEC